MMHNVTARLNSPFFFGVTLIAILATLNWGSSFLIDPEFSVNIKDVTIQRLRKNTTFGWDEIEIQFSFDADLTGVYNWNVKLIYVFLEVEYHSPEFNQAIFWDKIIWRDQHAQVKLAYSREKAKYSVRTKSHDLIGNQGQVKLQIDVVPLYGKTYRLSSEPYPIEFPKVYSS